MNLTVPECLDKIVRSFLEDLKEDPKVSLERQKTAEKYEQEQLAKIEFEEITVKLPKNVMKLLRDCRNALQMTPEEYVAFNIVQCVRADLDCGDVFVLRSDEVVTKYGLQPILTAIINDPWPDC
jgi:transcription initiation factor IIE alpha subunit